jgi:hypothetical protein
VEKCGRAGQATDGSVRRRRRDAIGMLDNKGKSTDTLGTFNAHQWLRERASMLGYTYAAFLRCTAFQRILRL